MLSFDYNLVVIMNQYQPLFKDQSTRSLSKYRSQSIEQRVQRIGKEMLVPARKKDSKNVFTITTNTSTSNNHHRSEHRSEQQLNRRIRMLEYELKRKLNQDGIIRNLFRTKQTHELNHIDLYLQLRNLEDKYNELTLQYEESRKSADQCEAMLREQEEEHMKNMEELNVCLNEKEQQWIREKQQLKMENGKLKLQGEEFRFLIEQLQKKNGDLVTKNKDLSDELSVERDSKNWETMKVRQELEMQIQQLQQQLQTVNTRLEKVTQQYESCSESRKQLQEEVQSLKDRQEKLQLHVDELQNVNRQLIQKEELFRKEQNQKYTSYYEQIRQQHEQQIDAMASQHLAAIKQEKKLTNQAQQLNQALQETLKKHEKQIIDYSLEIERMTQGANYKEMQLHTAKTELQKQIETNARLSRELKEANFSKQESQQEVSKLTFENRDREKVVEKMQLKLVQSEQQCQKLIIKCQQLKSAADNSQAYRKLNDRVYNQNYKTLGRLIQINNQIKQHLEELIPEQECKDLLNKQINLESLTDVVSSLAELLACMLKYSQNILKERSEERRDRNIEMRQITSILDYCKNVLSGQEALTLMSQYIAFLKERKPLKEEQKKQRLQTYHQLVQCLINANSQNYFSSDNRPQFIKDSLDSTYLIREFESKKKEQKWLQRQSSGKNIKKKQRIETEPSQYDLPLKRKLVIDDEDKENVNFIANKPQMEAVKRQSNPTRYLNEIRERISQKYPSKRKDPKEELRSEVEKKYFRF